MGFVRCAGTTWKVGIPVAANKEAELIFLHGIVNNLKKCEIPSSLVPNLDETNSKYVCMGKRKMTGKGSNYLPISGLISKRSFTATVTITLNGKFLSIQLIYWGKTNQNLLKNDFSVGFSLFTHPKHYSNTADSIKLIKEIIIPYNEQEIILLTLPKTQPEFLIMDVFREQMTVKCPYYS